MLDKPAGCGFSRALFKNFLTLTVVLCAALLCSPAQALVGGGGPNIVPVFTQNLGGGSSNTALPPPTNSTNVVPFTLGTTITFDPSSTYLPVSPNPNQTYLYAVTWDFGDPSPDLFVEVPVTAPLDPNNPVSLARLLGPVAHTYNPQGIYGPINANTPGGSPANLELGPKLIVTLVVQTSFTVTATATNGSATLTGVTSTTGLAVGGVVTGFGIPPGTIVASFTGNTITMNNPAVIAIPLTATATFGSPILTGIADTTGIAVGGSVTGSGIPPNTTVQAFTTTPPAPPPAETITMSKNAGAPNAAAPGTVGTFTIGATTGQYVITIQQPGTQATSQSTVKIVDANEPPVAVLTNIGSSPTVNGVPLTVTASNSYDPDGYIIYAVIDWGDGVAQLVPQPGAEPGFLVANATAGSNTLTLSSNAITAGITAGGLVSGLGIPPNTFVVSVAPPTITISNNAIATTAAGSFTFSLPANVAAPAFIPLLPNAPITPNTTGFDLPGIPIQHVYSAPGNYIVTLSVIDNGRLIPNKTVVLNPVPPSATIPQPLPFPLLAVPDPSNINAALASIVQFHQTQTTYGTEAIPNHRFDPQLAQAFLTVTVPGSLSTASSQFSVDFKKTSNDKLSLSLQLTSSTPLDTLSASAISLTVGTANGTGVPLAPFTFTTDARASFKSSNVKFSFDPRKQIIKVALTGVNLHDNITGGALNLKSQTVGNGSEDAKVTLVVNNGPPIVIFVRYEYKASAGSKGTGKNGHAILGGNSLR